MIPRWAIASVLALAGCTKVPLVDVNAGFLIADVSWFEAEQTLFVFYDVEAEQGLGEPSVIELTYTTDDERVDWTPLEDFEPVHTHVPVDCGRQELCGSHSLRVPIEPRDVRIRLRYHREGALSLDPSTVFNVIGEGEPHSHRSYIVYGVFDEANEQIQWRGRHVFPTLRNQQAEALGLRRDLTIEDQRYGRQDIASDTNPYGYGVDCPDRFTDAGMATLSFNERAAFNDALLPEAAASAPTVCAQATVTDATGTFTTSAWARKNPETRAAFPLLRSPVNEAVPLKFFLAPCRRTISEEHEEIQRQRLDMDDLLTTCTDDYDDPAWVEDLAQAFSDAVEAQRPAGEDMVLVVGLHRDDAGVVDAVEEALALVVPEERHRSSPRLAGAFVYDSVAYATTSELSTSTLWCPAPTTATGNNLTCAIQPDIPQIELGPFDFGFLPILPTRAEYLDFLELYSRRQAGNVLAWEWRAPEFAATSDHFDLGEFGVVTFLNGERFTADADDAFSYCVQENGGFFVFRSPIMRSGLLQEQAGALCEQDPEGPLCQAATAGVLPLQFLPFWHSIAQEEDYELGMFWDFPFLVRMEYEAYVAGAVSAFAFSVPFGVRREGEIYYGSFIWMNDSFSVEEMLTHCRRFCDHPTFDGAGVYRVVEPFNDFYSDSCYTPRFPVPGDDGFPIDP